MKRIINTNHAPAAIGPYSQAVEVNNTLYISGQIPINPKNGEIINGGIKEQTTQILNNIKSILTAAGYDLSNVVKTTCLLSDINNFKAMNEVYKMFFTKDFPARAAYEVAKLPLNVLIEIEAIAVK